MDINLLITFIILNIVNVITQTAKSIATVKCGKGMAAIVNAAAYSLYTVVIIYTVCDLPLAVKALVVGLCNLVGVYIVKWVEEKAQKDKLWKVEMTVGDTKRLSLSNDLTLAGISFNFTLCHKWALFNCYCSTKEESHKVKEIGKKYNAKFFASESKNLY